MSQSCEIDFMFTKIRHRGPTGLTEIAVATSIYIGQTWFICVKIANDNGNLLTYEPGLYNV